MHYINKNYLIENPSHTFVYGDNLTRKGYGGAATLRDLPNTYGFITKKYPSNANSSFYNINEYSKVFFEELYKLKNEIENNVDKIFLISKLGAGLANKYRIFEEIIEPNLKKELSKYENVKFLF